MVDPLPKIVSRSEAIDAGLKRYFTGMPCKHGHISERLVSRRCCVKCADSKMAVKRADNPEKTRENGRRQYRANPEKKRAAAVASRLKKRCAGLSAAIDRGLQSAKASGAILDLNTAIDLFKSQDNAFDFLETSPDHG